MYTREIFKRIRHIVPETLCSTDSTSYNNTAISSTVLLSIAGSTLKTIGSNFNCTIEATTGAIYVLPAGPSSDADAPTTANSFKISEGGVLDLRVKDGLKLLGDSTTAKFQAIVWGDD